MSKTTVLLTREEFLAAPDAGARYEDVPVPEIREGAHIRIREMSGAERDKFEESLYTGRGRKQKMTLDNVRARLVAWTAIDEAGHRLFKPGDVQVIGRKSAVVLDRLFDTARRLSGLSDEDIEELTENFPDDPSGDSISD